MTADHGESRSIIRSIASGTQLIGWLLVVLGVASAVAPQFTGAALAIVIGLVLLAAGALILLFGLRAREAGKGNLGLVIGGVTANCAA